MYCIQKNTIQKQSSTCRKQNHGKYKKKRNQKDYWVVENIQSSSHAKDSQIMGCRKNQSSYGNYFEYFLQPNSLFDFVFSQIMGCRKNQSSSHAKDSQIMGCRKILK